MADYAISNVPRRVVYAASGTGPYAFTFEILVNTDVAVYKDDALLTLTTDYTVTIAANGTGSITLVATPTGATQIAIVGSRAIQRTSDFVTGGDFFANTVNDELDSLTIFAQQNAEAVNRALQAPQTDPTNIDMTLPRASVRANKTLAFDANGAPTTGEVIGDNRGNWAAGIAYNKRDIVKDTSNGNVYYANTSHTSSGSQPITTNADVAKWDLLVDNASAGTSATAAAASATAAAASQSAAASSASAASTSATNAATSASGASTSATNAANSATAASGSATASDQRKQQRDRCLDQRHERQQLGNGCSQQRDKRIRLGQHCHHPGEQRLDLGDQCGHQRKHCDHSGQQRFDKCNKRSEFCDRRSWVGHCRIGQRKRRSHQRDQRCGFGSGCGNLCG